MKVWAHRGVKATRPENTIPSFEEAIKLKADGIVINIHMTKDGYLVVCHDETLNRTTEGKGFIKHFDLFEIKQLDAGSWFDKKYKGIKIPMIEDVVELTNSSNTFLNIVIKEGSIFYPGIEEKLIFLINKLNIKEKVLISSSDHIALKKIKKLEPELKTGFIVSQNIFTVEEYKNINRVDVLHYDIKMLDEEIVKECKRCDIELIVHLVNDEFQYKKALSLGADGIITDDPGRMININNTKKNKSNVANLFSRFES